MSDDHTPPPMPPSQAEPEVNPYAPPTTDPTPDISTVSEAEALRRPNLTHEASIKGIGALIILGGLLIIFTAISSFAALSDAADLIVGLVSIVIGIGQIIAGWSLHRFGKGARIVCSVLCGIMLVVVPLGTVMGAYFLYVLLGSKGGLIFSERYQEAIRLTPELKYRSPTWMKILLGLLVLTLIGIIIFGVMSS